MLTFFIEKKNLRIFAKFLISAIDSRSKRKRTKLIIKNLLSVIRQEDLFINGSVTFGIELSDKNTPIKLATSKYIKKSNELVFMRAKFR